MESTDETSNKQNSVGDEETTLRPESIVGVDQDKEKTENTTDEKNDANTDNMNGDNETVKDQEVKETVDEHIDDSNNDRNKGKKRKLSITREESASEDSVNEQKDIIQSTETTSKVDDVQMPDLSSDLNLPPKQTLGKGKRARIPNKRYSDIVLSPQRRTTVKTHSIENGDKFNNNNNNNNSKSDIEHDLEELANANATVTTITPVTTPNPAKRQKVSVDVNNPNYRKPFEMGWKRELVYRGYTDNGRAPRISGDIYYYSPNGKKLRSMREISENIINTGLTLENFTFVKEPLGLNDPEKEIIRDAKSNHKRALNKSNSRSSLSNTKNNTNKGTSPKSGNFEGSSSPRNRGRNLGNIKNLQVKLPNKNKGDKKNKIDDENMEVEPPPPPPPKRQSTRKTAKTPNRVQQITETTNRTKRRTTTKVNNTTTIDRIEGPKFMDNFLQNLSYGYNTLLYVFQYLKVQDLLRAGCVCTMWRDIASHPSLWKTVRMKNSPVYSFDGLANSLKKHGTIHLDLRKMLLPPNGGDDMWPEFSKAIEKVETLRKIELCRCPSSVIEQLAITNKDLEVINAVTIKCETINLDKLSSLKNLKELRLKSTSGLTIQSDITALNELTDLKCLSLTSIKDLNKLDLSVIAALTNLESLDLGECNDFPKSFGEEILIKLTKLERLRLEKGQGNCHTFEILNAVKNMPKLEQLELVNFDIKTGFDVALGQCNNIKKLLIIPTYISQSATTNHMVLGGVLRLQNTLSHFVWGVTLELLRVTELFVDQCEDIEKKKEKKSGSGDSIPVLKPVPLINDKTDEIPPAHDPPQVEILPLPNLQKLLLLSLPTTRVKILKIPFHATWRQSITDTVN